MDPDQFRRGLLSHGPHRRGKGKILSARPTSLGDRSSAVSYSGTASELLITRTHDEI